RDARFWWNVNRVEDMIWQYVPELDMLRTHQTAIAVWEEYRRHSDRNLTDIIRRHLTQLGITMPTTPPTTTPHGDITVDQQGVNMTSNANWGMSSLPGFAMPTASDLFSIATDWLQEQMVQGLIESLVAPTIGLTVDDIS